MGLKKRALRAGRITVLALLPIVLLAAGDGAAATWYVNVDNVAGPWNGTSWATAFKSIQSGVTAASSGGGEVWVAEGTYTATGTEVVLMVSGVNLYGGFVGTETTRDQRNWTTHKAIIDGQNARHGVNCSVNNTTLDGFTVTQGDGGGMSNSGSPTVTNCTFSGNTASSIGGGMINSGSPTVTNCTFSGNTGGGMSGGSGTVTNCTFADNTAKVGGGGISDCSGTVTNCIFSGNSAGSGGGMDGGSGTVTNCVFLGNRATSGNGGGMHNNSSSSLTVMNCTFSGNSALSGNGGGMYNDGTSVPTVTNCILWGDTPGEIYGSATVTYSCVQGAFDGAGNIATNPSFVGAGNLQLSLGSPCIDTGTSVGAPATDILGVSRPQLAGFDMGAYEYTPPAPTRIIRLVGNLAFGDVIVGQSATGTLTIYNDGNSPLNVTDISYPAGFSGAWNGTIPASGSQAVTVTFAPIAAQSYSGTVTVNSDKTSGTDTVPCSGTGIAATRIIRLVGDLAFGNVLVGQSATRILTIYNDGNSALAVSDISYPACFSGSWNGIIAAGASHAVTVTFAPIAVQSYGGTVTVNSDKIGGTNTIPCSGTGWARIIRLAGNLVFGNVPVGQKATKTLTIYNDGNSTLTVSGISYPSCFSGSWSGTIASGGSQAVTVTFAPVATQSYSGTVTVKSDKPDVFDTISCSGAGWAAPTRIIRLMGFWAFGKVTVGQSATSTLTIYNDGNSTLTVSGISYPPCFSGAWSGTIMAGGHHDVEVMFAPVAAQSYNGTVTVNSDKTDGANTIPCFSTGVSGGEGEGEGESEGEGEGEGEGECMTIFGGVGINEPFGCQGPMGPFCCQGGS